MVVPRSQDVQSATMDVTLILAIVFALTIAISFAVFRSRSTQPKPASSSVRPAKQVEEKADIVFYYGSQTGTAEGYAEELAEEAEEYGLVAKTVDLEDFEEDQLTSGEPGLCVFLMATYGEGDPTDNAIQFMEWLQDEHAGEDLTGLKYTVFGLGNRQYENYNFAGIRTDKWLEKRGGSRVFQLGLGDDDKDLESDFSTWREEGLWQAVCDALNVECKTTGIARARPGSQWTLTKHSPETEIDSELRPNPTSRQFDHVYPFESEVLENRELFKSERSCVHISVSVHKAVRYHTGDHLGVLPENAPALVDRVATRLGLDQSEVVSIALAEGAKSRSNKTPFKGKWTVKQVLQRCPDLSHTVNAGTLHLLREFATDEGEKAELELMGSHTPEGKAKYMAEIHSPMLSLEEVLMRFSSIKLTLTELLAVAPKLQVRYYSICSSNKMFKDEIHLCVAVVNYDKPDGRRHDGVASTYLQNSGKGSRLRVFVRKSTFHPPLSPKTPMLLIGPGTGVAPFRGFIQDREHIRTNNISKSDLGPCELYYGCRHKETEFLYPDELIAARDSGILTNLHLAFSRDSNERVYVQHLLKSNSKTVWELLDRGAYVYVCGLVEMSKDVIEGLQEIIRNESGLERADADKFWTKLKTTNRFKTDVWS